MWQTIAHFGPPDQEDGMMMHLLLSFWSERPSSMLTGDSFSPAGGGGGEGGGAINPNR